MNEQFALELHRAGDAIAELFAVSSTAIEIDFSRADSWWHNEADRHTASLTARMNKANRDTIFLTAVKNTDARMEITRCATVGANLGAVMAKTYRELFGVFEDTETDSE